MCKLRKELPPVNLAAVICDSWSGMTGKLVPGSIIVCSMGSSTARGVKITGVCRSPPLPDGVGRRRLAALSGPPDSAARRQIFFGSYCMYHAETDVIQQTWYGFSHHAWADLHIDRCKLVHRTILYVIHDVFLNVNLNLINLNYFIINECGFS